MYILILNFQKTLNWGSIFKKEFPPVFNGKRMYTCMYDIYMYVCTNLTKILTFLT
jgi:hypothetical protein